MPHGDINPGLPLLLHEFPHSKVILSFYEMLPSASYVRDIIISKILLLAVTLVALCVNGILNIRNCLGLSHANTYNTVVIGATWSACMPHKIFILGLPGSGKSTMSRYILKYMQRYLDEYSATRICDYD